MSRWNKSDLANLHHLNHLLRECARILLLNELCEDAFEIWQTHQLGQVAWMRVGENPALRNDDDAVADLLDDFKHMGDVEDSFALRREQLDEVFE